MMQILTGLDSTASALTAERLRLDVVAQNIANVHTTRGPQGQPYQRQQVVFESVLQNQQGLSGGTGGPKYLSVARVEASERPPRMIHNPSHPDANAEGMVAYPDINIHEEMVDLISASRAYEANLAVIKTARSMALQTLGIGKR